MSDWVIWQLCDSAFPTGAFAHSGGLEAAWQHGEIAGVDDLAGWIDTTLQQTASGLIPFVTAGWDGTPVLPQLDAFCDVCLVNHVANRASRAQGQALLMACGKAFNVEAVGRVVDSVRTSGLAGHHAPVFGAIARALDVSRGLPAEMFMFFALRGAVSCAVRLGICGPLQGQGLQHGLSPRASEMARRAMDAPVDQVAQTAPVADLLQGTQDRLYSRLFVS